MDIEKENIGFGQGVTGKPLPADATLEAMKKRN